MTRDIVPFQVWHYHLLAVNPSSDGTGLSVVPAEALRALERENTWTLLADDVPFVVGGTVQEWPGRHKAWLYIAPGALQHLAWMTEKSRWILSRAPGRQEATVRIGFKAGERFLKRLGFTVETPVLKAFGPDGEDHIGYVRHV